MKLATALVLAVLVLPAGASADYVLPHPRREHCRAHYIRGHRHGRIVCVREKPKAPVPSSAPLPTPPSAPSTPSVPVAAPEASKIVEVPLEQPNCAEWVAGMEAEGFPAEEIEELRDC